MLIQCGDSCVDMFFANSRVDDGGWVVCPCHRPVTVVDVLVCPMCGSSEACEALVEQENAPRNGEEIGTIDRFANTTRVRTPAVRRDKKLDHEKQVLFTIRNIIQGLHEPHGKPNSRSSKRAQRDRKKKKQVVVAPAVAKVVDIIERPKKRPKISPMDAVGMFRNYVLVEKSKRKSHRCGLYALNVHLRRLCKMLTTSDNVKQL